MNWVDLALAVLLIIRAYFGLKQGIIKGVLFLAASIIGVILAGNYYQPLSEVLGFIPIEYAADIVAFVLILSCFEIVAFIVIRLFRFTTPAVMRSWVNNVGGAVFGFLMGAIEWGALLALWVKFLGTGLVTESLLAGVLLDKVPLILALLPSEFDAVRNFFR